MAFQEAVVALRGGLSETAKRTADLGLSPSDAWNVLSVALLRQVLREAALATGLRPEALSQGRLFRGVPSFAANGPAERLKKLLETREFQATGSAGALTVGPWRDRPLEAFGQLYEALLAARPHERLNLRKLTGSYYTPEALTRIVVERAFLALAANALTTADLERPLRIVDPALGAGAFLLQAGRVVSRQSGRAPALVVQRELFGVDVSPLALAVAEASLWLFAADPRLELAQAGKNLRLGDALCSPVMAARLGVSGIDWPELMVGHAGFDLVIGNPPWVAFAGRAAQPLPALLRAHYRRNFKSFRGYPTLHSLFVELSARLCPRGVLALLIPSPVADLAGYRHVRSCLSETHTVCEPLLELGQDAFASVTQPCFALVAAPLITPSVAPERAFVLSERSRAKLSAHQLEVPRALERLGSLARLPPELFGEMGLQTSGRVTRELLYRGSTPPVGYDYPLLQGRDIAEFQERAARLFLKRDHEILAACRCRVREASSYASVGLVVRQTAAITIAALHAGSPFRNSLLAGFVLPEFPAELTLGLLNSQLFRALHLAGRRDARQAAFPQVKVAHLRALPAPPRRSAACAEIARLARQASQEGLTRTLRAALDAAVFEEFEITAEEAAEIVAFVRERAPGAGLQVPLTEPTD